MCCPHVMAWRTDTGRCSVFVGVVCCALLAGCYLVLPQVTCGVSCPMFPYEAQIAADPRTPIRIRTEQVVV